MGTGNKCIVCLTKYGLVAVGFIAVIIVLAYLMITTPWRAIIAVVIPPAAAAAPYLRCSSLSIRNRSTRVRGLPG